MPLYDFFERKLSPSGSTQRVCDGEKWAVICRDVVDGNNAEIVQDVIEKCCNLAVTLQSDENFIVGVERFRSAEEFFLPDFSGAGAIGMLHTSLQSIMKWGVEARKNFSRRFTGLDYIEHTLNLANSQTETSSFASVAPCREQT